jgi:hypothetical protein
VEHYLKKQLVYAVAEVLPTSSGNANAGIKKDLRANRLFFCKVLPSFEHPRANLATLALCTIDAFF